MNLFRRTPVADQIPEFPLRCQHCEEPIKLARARTPPRYVDAIGYYMCKASVYLPHRPTPNVPD